MMYTTEAIEAITAVENINQDIHESGDFEDLSFLEYRTNGYGELVLLFNQQLWSSEDDERKYVDEEEDIREPLEPYLRKEAQKLIDLIAGIKTT